MTLVALGTEDELSEAVGKRLLREAGANLEPWPILRRGGYGYLRSKMKSWRELANQQYVVLITDLDTISCPVDLIQNWFGQNQRPEKLYLRVAVREIESWLLADHRAMRTLLGKSGVLPSDPDALAEPKEHLLRLVEKYAGKAVKDDLLVKQGAVARQGLGYNALLSSLVSKTWDPNRAATRSESLRRTRKRLEDIAREVADSP